MLKEAAVKVAIVGAGAAGLFASLMLVRAGHEVVVLEQRCSLGRYRTTAPHLRRRSAVERTTRPGWSRPIAGASGRHGVPRSWPR
ncbi:MAG: NAD(P)-binding protein [Pseudonocardiales bacterium]|nr:NAD(P)-binding protein [Pseudonocardiales bacterium]